MALKKAITVLTATVFVLTLSAGALLVARPGIREKQRDQAVEAVLEAITSGQTEMTVYETALEVTGEAAEEEVLTAQEEEEFLSQFWAVDEETAGEIAEGAATRKLQFYGIIQIDKIGLTLPVLQGTNKVSMRYGAGHFKPSANFGQKGTCALLGHRLYTKGRHFNRLDELETGDKVTVQNLEGEAFTYTVYGVDIVEPKDLLTTLYRYVEGSNLALVTCHPVRIANRRLIVWCSLDTEGTQS